MANTNQITVRRSAGGPDEPYTLRSLQYTLSETGVALITLALPEKLNAMTANLGAEVRVALDHCVRSDDVAAVVWTGAGRAFCAGADQKGTDREVHVPPEAMALLDERVRSELLGSGPDAAWRARPPDELSRTWGMRAQVLEFLRCPKPLISAVNGLAVGGGANFALFFMDLVYCSTEARFSWPFSKLGITPELSSTFRFPAQAGAMLAKKHMMLGEWMSAEQAEQAHLATAVHPPETFLAEALAAAEVLAGNDARAVQLTKSLINRSAASTEAVNAALDREQHFTVQRMRPERGGDPRLTVRDFVQFMESGVGAEAWPVDGGSAVARL